MDTVPRTGADSAQAEPLASRGVLALVLAVIALAGIWVGYRTWSHKADPKKADGARATNAPVPVVAGVATRGDRPIHLDGLGTVQAFNSVVVHSRVDGQIVEIAFAEGADVKAGDVLARIDPAPYQAAHDLAAAKKAQDEASLENARADLRRYDELVANQGTTQQTRDTQASMVAQVSATVRADQAAVDAARVNLDYATIRSPIDGRVGLRQVDQGNVVRAADPGGIVVVAQLRPIAVVFTLPEQMLARLPRPATNLPVQALARDGEGVLAEGTLAVIDNQIDATTGTIRLKAVFPNEDLRLWPGQFVNARLVSEVRSNAIVVPASVVQRGPDGPFAFVIRTNDTVEPRPIRVGQTERGEAIIEDGLKAGERVVVDGQYRLQSGSTVRAAERPGAPAPKTGGRRAP